MSWCVGEVDDPDYVRSQSGYESAEFLITTGKALAPLMCLVVASVVLRLDALCHIVLFMLLLAIHVIKLSLVVESEGCVHQWCSSLP